MAVEIPKITKKYITTFKRESDYEAAYPTFEEVNWSNVAPVSSAPDSYRTSRRLSNMYHKNNPPNYKFDSITDTVTEGDKTYTADAAKLFNYNENDDIRKTFFLEIIWGYSGWEWHDYERVIGTNPETEEPITETLKGGNLYKIKEIETVPHIIDGHRLYHINDFLNSQDKVTTIEEFYTTNLKAMNRAFKRLTLKHNLNTITPLLLNVYEFPNVVEADDVFFNNKISVINNNTIEFPLLKSVDGFYQRGEFIDGTTFRLNSLESFTDGFFWTNFSQTDFNLSNILIGDSLKKVSNLSGLLQWAMFYNGREDNDYDNPVNTFTIDLSGSSLAASTEFNLSYLAYRSGTDYRYPQNPNFPSLTDRYFVYNITLKGLTDLSSAFRNIMWREYSGNQNSWNNSYNQTIKGVYYSGYVKRTGPTNMEVNFHNTEGLIRNLDNAFAENIFIEQPPKLRNSGGTMINAWANDYTTENYIYQRCRLEDGITYDFSPNHVLNSSQGQFNDCYIDPTKTISFNNVDALRSVRFQNITFGTETVTIDGQQVTRNIGVPFPYSGKIHNDNYQYDEEDPTNKHRFVSFSGSMFTELTHNQSIYCDMDSSQHIFKGCSRIDFTGLDIDLYLKGAVSNTPGSTLETFRNCSSMIETPEVHANFYTSTNQGTTFVNIFRGCPNLETINASDFQATNWTDYSLELSDSPNLKYLNVGNVIGGFNLSGCYRFLESNDALDMLADTLNRQTSLGKNNGGNNRPPQGSAEGLWIQGAVWDALNSRHPSLITKLNNLPNKTIHYIQET